MRTRLSLGFVCAAVTVTVWGAGQQRRNCELDVKTAPGSESHYVRLAEGDYRLDAGGGVEATCGTTWVRADSATYFEGRGQLYLYGNVRYRSEGRTMEADRATYYANEERVRAEGNVVLTDLAGGSTLEGPVLEYFPETETRPIERIFAPNRPHLTFYPDTASRSPDAEAEPFQIDADQVHIYGDSVVAGAGRVVVTRSDLNALGDSMHLDLGRNRLWLLGDPRIEASDLVLEGDTITALLEEHKIREIEAWPNASAVGREMSLNAPILRLFAEAGDMTRAVAWAGDSERDPEEAAASGEEAAAPQEPSARAESENYVLTADSIDILRPGGLLQEVRAIHRARAVGAQPVVPDDPVFGRDWLEGDSIIGYFEPVDLPETSGSAETEGSGGSDGSPSKPDSTGGDGGLDRPSVSTGNGTEVELRRLIALGNARALYHVPDNEGPPPQAPNGAQPSKLAVNYVIGRIVTIWLRGGEVLETEVIGPSTGLYLEPLGAGEAPDSAAAAADSAQAGGKR